MNGSKSKWIEKNRDGLIRSFIVVILGSLVNLGLKLVSEIYSYIIINIALIAIILLQRIDIQSAVNRFKEIVIYELGGHWRETQYSYRNKHFIEEKLFLSRILVEELLPYIIKEEGEHHLVRIFIDSGTTLYPAFKLLLDKGLVPDDENLRPKIHFYTNSLSGIESIQSHISNGSTKFSEEDFTFLGGTPLARYRATTGSITEASLKEIFEGQESGDDTDGTTPNTCLDIAILASNWILCGNLCNSIQLCARGRGHLDFKKLLHQKCKRAIIVAPLGKILCIDSVNELNDRLKKEVHLSAEDRQEYGTYFMPEKNKETTLLLTTQRDVPANIPFHTLSKIFHEVNDRDRKNFRVWSKEFSVPGTTADIKNIEMPHPWTRKHRVKFWKEE